MAHKKRELREINENASEHAFTRVIIFLFFFIIIVVNILIGHEMSVIEESINKIDKCNEKQENNEGFTFIAVINKTKYNTTGISCIKENNGTHYCENIGDVS